MPAAYNLSIYRGDTTQWTFLIWSDASKTTPVDLTGYTAKAQLRDRPGGSTIVPTTVDIIIPNTLVMTLDSTDSKNTVNGVWDLQLTSPDSTVVTIVAGQVTVTPDVTDSTP